MAELQLSVCSVMDPAACNPSLPATNQERCHPEVLKEHTQLEHLKNNIEQQLLCNNDKLADLHLQKRQRSFCSHPAENTHLILEKAGFYSAGPFNWYFKGQASTLPAHWRTRRREGVDRAYPLKPVFHHKGRNVPLPISWQAGNLAAKENPSEGTSSEKKEKSHILKSQHAGVPPLFPVGQSKISAPHSRAESGYIQKLEAAGRSLEEEIQRKEALLKEKLRRTEEELRRIQWERQQTETKARREQGALRMSERKAADIAQGRVSRPAAQLHTCEKIHVSESPAASLGAAMPPQLLPMERLKKQRLVASNSKIRENILATSSPELAPLHDQSLPAATPLGQLSCVATDSLITEDPSNVEEWGECNICERKLYRSRLEKHISICSKNHGSKREVFDSSKARAKGTELETYHLLKGSDISQKKFSSQSSEASKQINISKQSNWRQKHDSFIKTLRRAREVQQVISKGGKASDLPPAPAMENPDYKLCPYCTRQFAPKVAERHIPKCKNIKNRPPPPQQKKRC
nr:zinc finger C2HC domain-containing protein 1C [Pogona vitticeps]XP_020649585.1 zinc finger C2HC domain-containing protein 1C [Pogona vitticeps]